MRILLSLLASTALLGCSSAYYKAAESVGYQKREILVDRVEEAQETQAETKEQFSSALDQFRAVVNVEGGELETLYDRMNREYRRSEAKADELKGRIASVDNVAQALFDEWEDELDDYQSAALRNESAQTLRDTRGRYATLINAMESAYERVPPVLEAFEDQVLFLKHNLNARAVASLQGELTTIESDVATLIREMDAAIAESDRFIEELRRAS